MRSWQWAALVLGPVLIGLVVLFPYTRYIDVQNPWVQKEVRKIDGGFTLSSQPGWHQRFMPVWQVRELHNQESPVSSGRAGQPNWLVTMLLAGAAALLCGFVVGYRPRTFPGRGRVFAQACWAFLGIACAAMFSAMIAVEGFEVWDRMWKRLLFFVVVAFVVLGLRELMAKRKGG
jgi:hypothetical protein